MNNKIIIAGGGTGGHIFPAVAVAKALHQIDPSIEILFVGAAGKMEMEKVPEAGFNIKGLDIAGFNRSKLWKNWSLPFKLIRSFIQVSRIFKDFNPSAVFGVGGYSSFPVLKYAQKKGIPSFIHESNSFAGKSNIMLGKNATMVMVATDGMDKFFPENKIVVTGNPVRSEISNPVVRKNEALEFFGMKEGKRTILIIGGSMGARSINQSIAKGLDRLMDADLQVIWQTGKASEELMLEKLKTNKSVCITSFISKMHYAYMAADLVVSRAGAIALAEICAMGKPSILVPYPFAAEDHQTVNALNMANHGGSIAIEDANAGSSLVDEILTLVKDEENLKQFGIASKNLYYKDADMNIANLILDSINTKHD
jgi:UDP-N-acetylglucosamine--N-acetylmuramyl-(pentapeptide) pyrophosphoryl-undecaprenol N-acetylglucosamine transferase